MVVCIVIIFNYVLIRFSAEKHLKRNLAICALLMAVVAYSMQLYNHYDLVFHFNLYASVENIQIFDLPNNYYFSEYPVYVIFVYLLTFAHNPHILPFASTLIGYGICFYLIYRSVVDNKLFKKEYSAIFLFVSGALPFLDFSAGIREALAFSLFVLCLYTEMCQKKRRLLCWIGYLLAINIHSATFLLFVLRVVILFVKKHRWIVALILLQVGICSKYIVMGLSYLSSKLDIDFLNAVAQKLYSYAVSGNQALYEYGIVIVRLVALLIVLATNYYMMQKSEVRHSDVGSQQISNFNILHSAVTLGFIFQYDIFVRNCVICVMMLPLISGALNHKSRSTSILCMTMRGFGFFNLVYYTVIYYLKFKFSL